MGEKYDLLIIGSGAASSAAWTWAAAQGLRVAVFERDTLGGECPNYACVPSKALLQCAEVLESARGAARFGVVTGPIAVDFDAIKARKELVHSRTGAAEGEELYRRAGVDVIHSE